MREMRRARVTGGDERGRGEGEEGKEERGEGEEGQRER